MNETELEIMRKLEKKAHLVGGTQGEIVKMSANLIANMDEREFLLLQKMIKEKRKIKLRFRAQEFTPRELKMAESMDIPHPRQFNQTSF